MRGISWVVSRPSMSSRTVTRLPVGSSSTAIQIAPNPRAAISSDTRVAMSSRSAIDANRDVIFANKRNASLPCSPAITIVACGILSTQSIVCIVVVSRDKSARIAYYMVSFR